MSYAVAFERRRGTLRVHLSAPRRDYAGMLVAWQAIVEELAHRQAESLLVVSDVQGPPLSVAQIEAFVHGIRGRGLEQLRIAYVYPHVTGWAEAQTAEILALEAGFEARVFDDERAADTWLRHGER